METTNPDSEAKPIRCFTVENEDVTLFVYADTKLCSENGVGFFRGGDLVLQVMERKKILNSQGVGIGA